MSAAGAPPLTEEGPADPPDTPPRQAATAEPAPAPERTPPPAIGEGAGWEWINWGRAGLRDGSVPINAAGRELVPGTVRNRVVRLGRHRTRASRSGAANLFRAVLADGSRVEGMVFPGALIWDDDPPPRANAGLVGKGR